MTTFLAVAPLWLHLEYAATTILTLVYLFWKVTRRGYVFSPYSIVLLMFAFALIVCGPLQYRSEAWSVLSNSYSAAPFYRYLNLSMSVNLAGFGILLTAMWIIEARDTTSLRVPLSRTLPTFSPGLYAGLLMSAIAVFTACLLSVGAIPLFGDRTVFYEHQGLRPVYNAANFMILICTSVLVVWVALLRSKRYRSLILCGLACMLLTGGRTSFLSVIELAVMLTAYIRHVGSPRRLTLRLSCAMAVIGLVGIFLASLRASREFEPSRVLDNVLYGNTFSDIRDGAYILYGWDLRYGLEYLGGRTYLAGLLSFVPSSMSEFRGTWSWGYFTTEGLFGYSDHYGFRGGWSLEAYMNFGQAGVVVFAVLGGLILGSLERVFYNGVVRQSSSDFPSSYAASWIPYTVFTVSIASSATYNLYTLAAIGLIGGLANSIRRGMDPRTRHCADFLAPSSPKGMSQNRLSRHDATVRWSTGSGS